MSSPYSHKQFFRRVPNALLSQYFKRRNVALKLDFAELKETDSDSLFDAFTSLPEGQQGDIEAQFQDVHAMASEGGVRALIDEADFHQDEEFAAQISAIEGFHQKAMWAFLEKETYWRGANMFLHADNVSFSFWKKRNDLPQVPPKVEDEDVALLAKGISAYFHRTEGRGKNCKVEPYRRNEKEYFFAYPEDYAQSGVEWVSNSLKTRARHPAFEIIFVYSQEEGSLDIYAPKNTKAVPELQKLFAKHILGLDTLPDGEIDKRVYDLKPVTQKEFEFNVEPEMGIQRVEVTKLRLKLLEGGAMRRITLEASTTQNPRAVYDLLDEITAPKYMIDQVGVLVVFDPVDGKRGKTKRFNIGYPNSCALSYDGNDLVIRQMLAKSGLEPRDESNAQ